MAAWACEFEGARGGMYRSSKKAFTTTIEAYIKGTEAQRTTLSVEPPHHATTIPVWCDNCLVEA